VLGVVGSARDTLDGEGRGLTARPAGGLLKSMLNSSGGLDRVFKAVADPTRRAIVDRLALGEASLTELARPFDMSLPAVHQHLRLLEESGLVVTSKTGRVRSCRLDPKVMRQAEEWLARRRAMWERRLDALDRYLEREPRAGTRPKAGGRP
jgi:DNA-binding transcriptional ArsR family regulator